MPNYFVLIPMLDGFVIRPAIAVVFVAAWDIYSPSRPETLAQPDRKPSAMKRAASVSSSEDCFYVAFHFEVARSDFGLWLL